MFSSGDNMRRRNRSRKDRDLIVELLEKRNLMTATGFEPDTIKTDADLDVPVEIAQIVSASIGGDNSDSAEGLETSIELMDEAFRIHAKELDGVTELNNLRRIAEQEDPFEIAGHDTGKKGNSVDDIADAIQLDQGERFGDPGFMPEPTTQARGIQNGGSDRAGKAPVTPGNPVEAATGIAGLDHKPKTHDQHRETNGDEVETETNYSADGRVTSVRTEVTHPEGTRDIIINRGGGSGTRLYFDSDGHLVLRVENIGQIAVDVTRYDSDGDVTGSTTYFAPFNERIPGPDRTQDPDSVDADGSWARWMAGIGGGRIDLSLGNPDRTIDDPDGDHGPATDSINPGESIVVNPDANGDSGQAREVSRDRAEHWKQQLMERDGGIVQPE